MAHYTIQFESPELQGVYFVGETLPIRFKILQGDRIIDDRPLAMQLNDEPFDEEELILEKAGRYKLFVQYYGVSETVVFHAIIPNVVDVEFLPGPCGDNLYPLYHHRSLARAVPYYRVDSEGWEPVIDSHPACYRLGTRPRLRVRLNHEMDLKRARRIDVVARTSAFSDLDCPSEKEPYGGQAMVFRIPKAERGRGVEVRQWPMEIELTADDVREVAAEYLHPEGLTILVVGNAEEFEQPLSNFGDVNEIVLE